MKKRKKIAKEYVRFCEAEGSNHIASEFAILKLQELIDYFKIKSVLEVGLGIGAIAGSLLSANDNLEYTGTENNEFCLLALKTNLAEKYLELDVFSEISEVPPRKFDLIVIDGKDGQLVRVKELISATGMIAIEGDRVPQLEVLDELFPKNRIVHSISLVKNKPYSPFHSKSWQGGLKIIFVDPSNQQFLWWWKEKIKTKIKYQYPGRYLGGSKRS